MNTSFVSRKRFRGKVPETVNIHKSLGGTALTMLLICGIISSLWYVAINIIVPPFFPGYHSASRTVSELSTVGAPTRTMWMLLATPYTLFMIAFAWGVPNSARSDRRLRIVGGLLLVYGAMGLLWPFAPMHLRETLAAGGGTWKDTAHIVLGAVTEILYVVALAFAAAALGKPFRLYSIITFVVLLFFGALTFLEAPGIAANKPTPLIGIWERMNIGVFLLWIVVLAVHLLRREHSRSTLSEVDAA